MNTADHDSDLFIALRRAIITDPDNDGAECDRAAALITHLEPHQPLQLWGGDEECRLAECDHPRDADGLCAELVPAGKICTACSAVYDSGSEYGPEWFTSCRVGWPCPPLVAVAARYNIPLPVQVVAS
jgi:hypothetical protein